MSHRIIAVSALLACGFACGANPALATTYDFSSVLNGTVTPYPVNGATFDSPDALANGGDGFTFGPNSLYSQLDPNHILSSGGYAAQLTISFATAQTGISFDYAIGDEFVKTEGTGVYVGNGTDMLTFTTNTGYTQTVNLAAPATNINGPAYIFPQGLFSLSGGAPFNSVTITAADITGEDSLAISTLTSTPVPLPATLWLLMSGLAGVAGFTHRRRMPALIR